MTWPAPTRADHQRFCVSEGWREVRDARGGKGTHHIVYELDLPDGRVLRTRISHPPGRVNYGASVWRHILRDQLGVSEAEFWACVKDGVKPQRGVIEPPKEAVPLEVVSMLINRVGLPESEVAQLSRQEAIARLNQYWTESPSDREPDAALPPVVHEGKRAGNERTRREP